MPPKIVDIKNESIPDLKIMAYDTISRIDYHLNQAELEKKNLVSINGVIAQKSKPTEPSKEEIEEAKKEIATV